jgi:putative endonuclease
MPTGIKEGQKGTARDMINKRQLGSAYESLAAEYLRQQGYEILEQNYRNRQGEIDIVAKEGETLCFVEVKFRSGGEYGKAAEAVNRKKQHTIVRVAQYYLMRHGYDEWTPCRFDVVAIDNEEISLIRNAYEAT